MAQIYNENLETAVIDTATSGDNTLISAVSGAYIAIDHINLVPTTAVGVTFKSDSTDLSGTYPLDAKQPITIENVLHNQKGIITCNQGEAFVLNLDSAVQVDGFIRYRVVGR